MYVEVEHLIAMVNMLNDNILTKLATVCSIHHDSSHVR